ncbi:MAG: NAD-dependent epimerase/dehydratase family protein [Kiritimatiellae bacterium]|nr:NAD-dependent epimerase/dehydratase family protein [Kiritimatiellia bacterium]
MNILITGATGFIGSHLVDRLLTEGHEITALIRSSSNLQWLQHRNIRLVQGDLIHPASLKEAVTGQDLIFHIAGIVNARRERDFYAQNVHGTEQLLQATLNYNPTLKKFIYLSSMEASGSSSFQRPKTEQDESQPVSAYGLSKLKAEQALLAYKERIHILCVRPPMVYGPRDKGVYAIYKLVRIGLKVNIGFSSRYASSIYIADLVEGLYLCGFRNTVSGSIYYVNDQEPPHTWIDFQTKIARVLQKRTV